MALTDKEQALLEELQVKASEGELSGEALWSARTGAALHTISFGFQDELTGLANATAGLLNPSEDRSFTEVYRAERDAEREELAQYRRERPTESTLVEGAAAVGPGAGVQAVRQTARALPGATNLVKSLAGRVPGAGTVQRGRQAMEGAAPIARASVGGATAAGTYGVGIGEGDVGEQATSGAESAMWGAALGPALAGLFMVGGAVKRLVWDKLKVAFKRPKTMAQEALVDELRALGYNSAEEVEVALQEIGPQATIADLDPTLAGRLRNAMAHGTPKGSQVKKALDERDLGQQKRLWAVAEEVTGEADPYQRYKKLTSEQRKEAKPMYEAAYAADVEPTPELMELLGKPAAQRAYTKGRNLALDDTRRVLDVPPGKPRAINKKTVERIEKGEEPPLTTEEWDWIQRGLRARRDQFRRGTDQHRVLTNQRQDINSAVDTANPLFGKARKTYAGYERVKEAMELGGKVLDDSRMQVEELADILEEFTPSETQGFRVGVSRAIKHKIGAKGRTHDATKIPLFQRDDMREKLVAIYGQDGVDKLMDQAAREATMRTTKQIATGPRSPTADILMSREGGAGVAADAAIDLATGGAPVATGRRMLHGRRMPSRAETEATVGALGTPPAGPLNMERTLGPLSDSSMGRTLGVGPPGTGGLMGETLRRRSIEEEGY